MKSLKLYSILYFLPIISLIGCKGPISQAEYDAMVFEKDAKIAELEEKVAQLEEHIVNLETKTEEVNEQFERLESENWRDVVPDADNALENLNSEIENNPNSNY